VEQIWKRVTVGPDTFEALSSEERISILKLLDTSRQLTGTDVANALGISKSSAFKQLNRLARAGLVERMDEGRKWIYYRNTSKAERLLHPDDVTIHLVLSAAVAAVLAGFLIILSLQPILGPSMGGADGLDGTEPRVLVLGNPTLMGGEYVVEVFSGAAQLSDVDVLVYDPESGVVIAVAGGPAGAPSLITSSRVQPGAGAASVSVLDLNADGWIGAGDRIVVSGVEGEGTLAVSGHDGALLASVPLAA